MLRGLYFLSLGLKLTNNCNALTAQAFDEVLPLSNLIRIQMLSNCIPPMLYMLVKLFAKEVRMLPMHMLLNCKYFYLIKMCILPNYKYQQSTIVSFLIDCVLDTQI